MRRSRFSGFSALVACALAACTGGYSDDGTPGPDGNGDPGNGNGNSAGNGSGTDPGGTPNAPGGNVPGGTTLNPGGVTAPPEPFEPVTAFTSVRKVKNLLTGMAPTDAEVAAVTATGAAGLQGLINTWMTTPEFQDKFREKMVFFFRNFFQQTGFTPTEDFKPQLLQNGGFDFGPFGASAVGDDIYFRLVQNVQDSFAITAWQLVAEGRPFTEVLTTKRFLMTTALKALYVQIEMPNDQPFAFRGGRGQTNTKLEWQIDYSGTPIPLEESITPGSANFMVFDDQAPVTAGRQFGGGFNTCRTTGFTDSAGATQMRSPVDGGYAQLFQRLIGYTPRTPFSANIRCVEHASKPYFSVGDVSDWTWVTVNQVAVGTAPGILPYEIPKLRSATQLDLVLPRVGFFSTPAYLALWSTNDSNQHRVTANQTLLVSLGRSFTSENTITPVSTPGLDSTHAVDGSECVACHKSLDPLRQFWASYYDFNDRNDFITQNFMGGAPNPRITTPGGVLAFANMNAPGTSLSDLGTMIIQVSDTTVPDQSISRFALAVTQAMCFFANSSACVETDPEYRRVALAFQSSNFNFPSLIKELFASPLVTGAVTTQTFDTEGQTVSIARRDQMCQALSNRLGKPDICALAVPVPSQTQTATSKIATAIPADAFSRGAESPVTAPDPTLFYRSATEMLCENVAPMVVDAATGTLWTSTDATTAIGDMVQRIIGYPPTDPHYAQAVAILTDHFTQAQAQAPATGGGRGGGASTNRATNALRSTFVLACESPTFLSFGL